MRIMPYNIRSKSARLLAEALNCKRVRHDSTTFTNRHNHTIINWGYGGIPVANTPAWQMNVDMMLNMPYNVGLAGNKLVSFRVFERAGIPIPEWTTDIDGANRWASDGIDVVARTKLRGHSGDGIEINITGHPMCRAPLYVKYIKKTDEYRYHVFNGEVIDIQHKRKRREISNDDVDYKVRNSMGGWVYCRSGVNPHSSLASIAIRAVGAIGLDFGAVDIIWNEHYQKGYVLEVNTACGLEGETVNVYANAIRRAVRVL